jgi:hypothetical protein
VDNVETTIVTLTVGDDTDTTHVATTGDHGDDTSVELDEVGDLAGLKVDLDGVVDLDGRVGVADGAGIVRDEVGDALLSELDTLHLAELVGSLGVGDAVDGETSLGVVDETEVLAGLLDRDDVHESSGEGGVGADLAVDLDEALHDDGLDLTAQPLAQFKPGGAEKSKCPYRPFRAYFSRLRMNTMRGMQSLSLWGPGEQYPSVTRYGDYFMKKRAYQARGEARRNPTICQGASGRGRRAASCASYCGAS